MTGTGAREPRAIASLHDAATGRRFVLEATGLAVIGRRAPIDVQLGDDPFVSRRHAQLVAEGGDWFLVDLASANGSFVNQRRVTGARRLEAGDLIQVGNTSLRFDAPGSRS
jgi:pSer/pThr/pTyr-binding forkhead associated (FHA) protein